MVEIEEGLADIMIVGQTSRDSTDFLVQPERGGHVDFEREHGVMVRRQRGCADQWPHLVLHGPVLGIGEERQDTPPEAFEQPVLDVGHPVVPQALVFSRDGDQIGGREEFARMARSGSEAFWTMMRTARIASWRVGRPSKEFLRLRGAPGRRSPAARCVA